MPALREAVAKSLFTASRAKSLLSRWAPDLYARRGDACLRPFVAATTRLDTDFEVEAGRLGVTRGSSEFAQMLCLRGNLGGGVLEHVATLRHRVNYGINARCAPASCTVLSLPASWTSKSSTVSGHEQ